ncbi:MAG: energy-coupling factor transporter transmembrane protein EcfT [Candidatus Hydrogenedentes bacterium]|nr:energy-coupling factor transporter transmembrane protein EcfT [Candidatus Hydrogenedentota bacterium]
MWHPVSQGNSPVHRVEPRVRILVAVAVTMTVYAITQAWVLGGVFVASCALVLAARIPYRDLRDRLLALNVFLVLLVLTLPWNAPGEALFCVGGAQYSREGLYRALVLSLKANALLFVVTSLVSTIEVTRFGASLESMGMPVKLTRLLLFAARYLEIISLEYTALRRTLLVRGFKMAFTRHGLRTVGYLLGMLFVRSFERAERITAAMKCRGFDGHFPRAAATPVRSADLLFGAVCGAACAYALLLQYGR